MKTQIKFLITILVIVLSFNIAYSQHVKTLIMESSFNPNYKILNIYNDTTKNKNLPDYSIEIIITPNQNRYYPKDVKMYYIRPYIKVPNNEVSDELRAKVLHLMYLLELREILEK